MLWPLLTMMVATKCYFIASLFGRVRTDLLSLESGKDWVRQIAEAQEVECRERARRSGRAGELSDDAFSWDSFIAIGGYAAYVWPAYAVFFIVLIADYAGPSYAGAATCASYAPAWRARARENDPSSPAIIARAIHEPHSQASADPCLSVIAAAPSIGLTCSPCSKT